MLGPSAHSDTFARDNLPPPEEWPDFLLDGFDYPERLNAGVELTDRLVEKGFGDNTALIGNGRRRTYKELTNWTNRLARARVENYGIKPGNGGAFARQCLITRRLLERGVRFIQLWTGDGQPWDNHDEILEHKPLAERTDKPIAALMTDLKMRGLFDETLMIWGGEFGRTPAVELPTPGSNAGKQRGRDHNHYGFTTWLAGGGVKGGHVHGATDEFGFAAVEDPVHVRDLHATILALLGFDHSNFTYRYAGLDFRLTGISDSVKVIRDIIA